MDSSDLSDGAVTLQEYLELKKALAASEAKVQQLMKVNSSLSDELRRLQREVRMGSWALLGGEGARSQRWQCCPGFLTPLSLSDPQAAGREPADPAASRASAHTPSPQRASRARTRGTWREHPPQGPPGLFHV